MKITGSYNVAEVMLPDGALDKTTEDQIRGFLNEPFFAGGQVRIMPDCHAGKGSVIGYTHASPEFISPETVGVDIGCGMQSVCISEPRFSVEAYDKYLRDVVPVGTNVREHVVRLSPGYTELIIELSEKVGMDPDRALLSIGTLGGGNHFIELGVGPSGLWITIHSGSRQLGLKICQYHQKVADRLGGAFARGSEECADYLKDLTIAAFYAEKNRRFMMAEILKFFSGSDVKLNVSSVHNTIGLDGVIRKGAIPAHEGTVGVIPFNNEDGLIIVRGKGNPDWNYSAPHGAGRVLSRSKAKKVVDINVVEKRMKEAGIYTTSLSPATLDEAKEAYKPMDLILEAIKPTVELLEVVKPISNRKG